MKCKPEENFAPAGATKGLSDRPLETFGCILLMKCKPKKNPVFPLQTYVRYAIIPP